MFASLDPWEERRAPNLQLGAMLAHVQAEYSQIPGAIVFGFGLPPILGLGSTGGFEFMLEDRAGGDTQQLADSADALLDATRQKPEISLAQSSFRNSVPQYRVVLDTDKAQTLGVPVTDVYDALQTYLGGLYVNDFNRFSRTWRVFVQAEQEYRENPRDINRYYVRSAGGDMVPLSTLVSVQPMTGPEVIYRYNRFRTSKITGQNSPGFSSGQAADAMEAAAQQSMPTGFGYEWTGTVYQQKLNEGKEGILFGFAGVMVFLFLCRSVRKLEDSFRGAAGGASGILWRVPGGDHPLLPV